jgi:hypothetical protein
VRERRGALAADGRGRFVHETVDQGFELPRIDVLAVQPHARPVGARVPVRGPARGQLAAGTGFGASSLASSDVRAACANPRPTSTAIIAASAKEAIAPISMIWPIFQKA